MFRLVGIAVLCLCSVPCEAQLRFRSPSQLLPVVTPGRTTNARVSRGRTPVPSELYPDADKEWMGRYMIDPVLEDDGETTVKWLDLAEAKTGDAGAITGEVMQVINDTTALIRVSTGRFDSQLLYVTDDFKDVVDDEEYTSFLELTGTKTYTTAIGSTSKVRTAKLVSQKNAQGLVSTTPPATVPNLRNWTYTEEDGTEKTVRAAYYGHDAPNLVLMLPNRQLVEAPVQQLSEEDREHAQDLIKSWRDVSRYLRQVPVSKWPIEFRRAAERQR